MDSYDLPTFEIDVTPWLGLLCDGNSHTFGIKVVGYDSDVEGNLAPIGQNWWVTGSVFVWLDEAGTQTTGTVSPRDSSKGILLKPLPRLSKAVFQLQTLSSSLK